MAVMLLHLQRAAEHSFSCSAGGAYFIHIFLRYLFLFWWSVYLYLVIPKQQMMVLKLLKFSLYSVSDQYRVLINGEDEERLTMSGSFFLRFLRSGLGTCCGKKNKYMFKPFFSVFTVYKCIIRTFKSHIL